MQNMKSHVKDINHPSPSLRDDIPNKFHFSEDVADMQHWQEQDYETETQKI